MTERARSAGPCALALAACLAAAPLAAQVQKPAARSPAPPAAPAAPPPKPAVTWSAEDWNPQAMPDDAWLPLPCGGAMAFRRVVTGLVSPEAGGVLGDRKVDLGWSNEATGYVDYARTAYVSGAFTDPRSRERYFLIGKYEVTAQQAAVLAAAPNCPSVERDSAAMPAVDRSWFDAVDLGRRYANWLLANHPGLLPVDGGQPGYVRLPTEVEWEYAVRGANAVTDAQRADKLYPMQGALSDNAWYAGPESADGRLNLVGLLKPNPIGLFDGLGNAEEIVLEPFHVVRSGRAHGQVGGFVVKGGSYETAQGELRSALRAEVPFFSKAATGETRRPTFGFRLVVAGPILGDLARATELRQAWLATGAARAAASEDPTRTLRALAEANARDGVLKAQLDRLERQLTDELGKRNEVEGRAARNLLLSAAVMREKIVSLGRALDRQSAAREALSVAIEGVKRNEDIVANLNAGIAADTAQFREFASVYLDLMAQLARDFPATLRRQQADGLAADLARSGRATLAGQVPELMVQVGEYETGTVRDTAETVRRTLGRAPRWLP